MVAQPLEIELRPSTANPKRPLLAASELPVAQLWGFLEKEMPPREPQKEVPPARRHPEFEGSFLVHALPPTPPPLAGEGARAKGGRVGESSRKPHPARLRAPPSPFR